MKKLLLPFSLLLIPFSLFALTLEESVQNSLETNPQMQKRLSEYKSTRYDLQKAEAGYKPTLNLTGGIGPERTERKAPDPDQKANLTRKEASLIFTENLFKGFNTEHDIEEQKSRIRSAQYYALQEGNALALRTAQGYLSILKNKNLLDLELENVKTHERIHKMIREKMAAGYGRRADLEQSEARLVQSYANYIAQQNNYQDSIVTFERHYGRIVPAETMQTPLPSLPTDTLDALVQLALHHNPTLRVEHSNVETQKARYAKEESPFYPILDAELSAGYQNNIDGYENNDRSYRAMLKLYYNLYNGGRDEATRLQNLQIITSQQLSLNEQERAVAEKVKLAWMAYQYYENRIRCLKMHVELSKKTAGSYAEEYHLGRRTLLDLLNVELEYTTARKELASAEDALALAGYRILESLGLLTHALNVDLHHQIGLQPPEKIAYAPRKDVRLAQYGDESGYLDITQVCRQAFEPILQTPIPIPEIDTMLDTLPPSTIAAAAAAATKADAKSTPAVIIDETAKGMPEITFANIHFPYNSAILSEQSKQELSPIAKRLQENTGAYLEIHGHTDNIASDGYNHRLSLARAEAAKTALAEKGIAAERIRTYGHSFQQPIADNATEEGRRLNRRIEFIIKKAK